MEGAADFLLGLLLCWNEREQLWFLLCIFVPWIADVSEELSVFEKVAIRTFFFLEMGWLFMWCILSAFNEMKQAEGKEGEPAPNIPTPSQALTTKGHGNFPFSPCMPLHIYTALKCPRPSVVLPTAMNCLWAVKLFTTDQYNSNTSGRLWPLLPLVCCIPSQH